MTEAQARAKQTYNQKVKRITIQFCPPEYELFEHLQKQQQKQTYLKDLIREDMKKGEA